MKKPRKGKAGVEKRRQERRRDRGKRPKTAISRGRGLRARADVNRHGLARGDLTEEVRRQVRQECYFGCVICGMLPYDYEHFDPPFEDAHEHRAVGIALLCTACHREKNARRLDPERIRRARLNPFNKTAEPKWITRFGIDNPSIRFGGNVMTNFKSARILEINGETIFGLRLPDRPGEDLCLEGSLCDLEGRGSLRFRDNEVLISQGVWDSKLEGPVLTLRAAQGEIVAQLEVDLVNSELVLSHLQMRLANGYRILADRNSVKVVGPKLNLSFGNNSASGGSCLVQIIRPELGRWEDWTAPANQGVAGGRSAPSQARSPARR